MQHDEWVIDCTRLDTRSECLATLTWRSADGTTDTFTQAIAPNADNFRGWTLPACEVRHLLLHYGAPETQHRIDVAFTPTTARAPGYTFALTVLHDPDIELSDPAWVAVAGGHRVEHAPDGDGSAYVALDDAGDLLHNGGPMLGVGGRVSDGGAFRLRFEYEVAIDEWILPGVALDYDLDDGVVLAPRVEIATPMLLVIPSLTVGLGLPIHLEADPDVGVRMSVGLNFLSLGFIATFDIYPGPETKVDSTLMFRFSL